jgi:hypothetical protein
MKPRAACELMLRLSSGLRKATRERGTVGEWLALLEAALAGDELGSYT